MSSLQESIRRAADVVGRAVVDAIYPKTCAGCGMRGMWLCDLCELETLHFAIAGTCHRCGERPFEGRCGCGDLPSVVDMARAFGAYDGWVSAAVKRLKYDREPDRARHLAGFLEPLLVEFGVIDALVPVPLHPRKERDRGFNQSRLIASSLSGATGIPIADLVLRTRHTVSQTALSGKQRRENVRDVFALNPIWHPRPHQRFVLIDDVRTTGATIGACATAISSAVPSRIGVLTVALDMQSNELTAFREVHRGLRTRVTANP